MPRPCGSPCDTRALESWRCSSSAGGAACRLLCLCSCVCWVSKSTVEMIAVRCVRENNTQVLPVFVCCCVCVCGCVSVCTHVCVRVVWWLHKCGGPHRRVRQACAPGKVTNQRIKHQTTSQHRPTPQRLTTIPQTSTDQLIKHANL